MNTNNSKILDEILMNKNISEEEKMKIKKSIEGHVYTGESLSNIDTSKPFKPKNRTMEEKIRRAKSLIERHGKDGMFFLGGD